MRLGANRTSSYNSYSSAATQLRSHPTQLHPVFLHPAFLHPAFLRVLNAGTLGACHVAVSCSGTSLRRRELGNRHSHNTDSDSVSATVLRRRAIEPAAAFAVYCTDSRSSISVFECKCALLRGLGINLTVKQIAAHLTASCGWVADGRGVSQAQFTDLYNILKKSSGSGKGATHYDTFDMRGKGWITEDDVYRVFLPVAPKFADKYVHDAFARADVHHVGQVMQRNYRTTLSELNTKRS